MKRCNAWALALSVFAIMSIAPSDADEPYVWVGLQFVCDNIDDSSIQPAREPIVQDWTGSYTVGDTDHDVYLQVENQDGTGLGIIDPFGLPTKGYHDNWISTTVPIDGNTWTVTLMIGGVAQYSVTETCPPLETPAVHVDPAPRSRPVVPAARLVSPVRLHTPRPA